jgi:hypothetical protein
MNETFSGDTNIQMNPLDSLRDLGLNPLESINTNEDIENQNNNLKDQNKLNSNSKLDHNYKELKNSDLKNSNIFNISNNLFNNDIENTMNLDTKGEEKLDNIILKKLNQKNHDFDFELQEAKDNNFISRKDNLNYNSNSDYSHRFSEEIEREFFEKIIVETKNPTDKFYSKNYKYVKCENITTIKIDDYKFSYLTNPINQEDFYFIKFSEQSFRFLIEDFSIYNKNLQKYTKIPYQIVKKFIEALNKNLFGLEVEIKKIRFFYTVKFILKCFLFFLISFSFLVWFGNNAEDFFGIEKNISQNILLALCIFSIMIIIYVIYAFRKSKMVDYHINKFFFKKQEDLDPVLYKWNADYFIDKMDYLAVMPRTFNYVMIIMKPNKKLLLKDHDFR